AMAHYSRAVHVWDLRALWRHLAGMGLDRDPPPFRPDAAPPPAAPLAVRVDPGVPGLLPAPVVAWTPAARRRAATAGQIRRWVEQLGDADAGVRAAAVKALEEAGPPALDALSRLA